MPDLRVAVVGYGHAGSIFHAPLVAATPGLTVATVVSSRPERQGQIRRDFPDATVAATPDDLFARDGEHDLVVVASPNDSHAQLARRAIEAGLPVVVDKPLAPSAAEAHAVVEEAERAGVLLTVFQNRR